MSLRRRAGIGSPFLLLTLIFAVAASAWWPNRSSAQEGLRAAIEACAEIDAATARLVCYDRAAGREDAATLPAAPPAERNAGRSTGEPGFANGSETPGANGLADSNPDPRTFGFDTASEEPQSITVVIVDARQNRNRDWVFVTEDGQRWVQTDDRRMSRPDMPVGAEIVAGVIGSYRLSINGGRTSIRVRRER